MHGSGSVNPSHPYRPAPGRLDPPRDPRSQSERRVSIRVPPSSDQATSGHHSGPAMDQSMSSRWLNQLQEIHRHWNLTQISMEDPLIMDEVV